MGRRRTAPRPTPRACFLDPVPGEVTVEGRKLVGSAQWRDRGALLQHGSILLVDEQHVVDALRTNGAFPATRAGTGGIALADVLDESPSGSTLPDALVHGFEQEFGVDVGPGALSTSEVLAADSAESRFADPAWTWRR
jgi:lipoate-protein ligase A